MQCCTRRNLKLEQSAKERKRALVAFVVGGVWRDEADEADELEVLSPNTDDARGAHARRSQVGRVRTVFLFLFLFFSSC